MLVDSRSLINDADEIVGFRVSIDSVWYDISIETAQIYGIYDKLSSVSTRSIRVHKQNGKLVSLYGMADSDFQELTDKDILSNLAVTLISQSAYYLMLKDVPVLYFNVDDFIIEILRGDLLPFELRGITLNSGSIKSLMYYTGRIKSFLSNRVLSLYRKNAKQILNLLKLSQSNDTDTRCKIALYCKALTVTDGYWVKREGFADTWEDVNLFNNHLDEALIEVALNGVSYSVATSCTSPELTTKGLFRKAWVRNNNKLILYKADDLDNNLNTLCEVISSSLLDRLKVSHCRYNLQEIDNTVVASCDCLASENISMVFASDIKKYCNDIVVPFEDLCKAVGGVDYHNMFVVDYLISNTDRHDENWGFYMSNETGKLLSMIPLYDHNLSLVSDVLGRTDASMLSNFDEYTTLREAALSNLADSSVDLSCDIEDVNYYDYSEIKTAVKTRLKELRHLKNGDLI